MSKLSPGQDSHLIAIAQVYSAVYAAVLCSAEGSEQYGTAEHQAAIAAANAVSNFDRFLGRRGADDE